MTNDAILSKREWEIAEVIAKGATKKEVANKLFISVRTVETHTKNIYEKIGARTPNGLSAWWFCNKFNISLDISEFAREVGAMCLLVLVLFTIVPTNNDDYLRAQRSSQARTARTVRSGKRAREGEAIELEGLINEA